MRYWLAMTEVPRRDFRLHAEMRLGPVSLRVKEPEPMLSFYEKDFGLRVLRRDESTVELGDGKEAASPILILKHDSKFEQVPADAAGLYHYALLVPDRKSLAAAYLSLGNAGVVFDGLADHLVSEALYITDPEGNGIEIYANRPRSEWRFDEDGYVQMATQPLDLDSLVKEVSGTQLESLKAIAEGTSLGHVHLKVTDLQRSIAFYRDLLGLDLMGYWGSAAFLSVGRYHHHIGMNTWESLGGPSRKNGWAGLEYFAITIPEEDLNDLSPKLTDTPFLHGENPSQLFVSDPDGIEIVLKT